MGRSTGDIAPAPAHTPVKVGLDQHAGQRFVPAQISAMEVIALDVVRNAALLNTDDGGGEEIKLQRALAQNELDGVESPAYVAPVGCTEYAVLSVSKFLTAYAQCDATFDWIAKVGEGEAQVGAIDEGCGACGVALKKDPRVLTLEVEGPPGFRQDSEVDAEAIDEPVIVVVFVVTQGAVIFKAKAVIEAEAHPLGELLVE